MTNAANSVVEQMLAGGRTGARRLLEAALHAERLRKSYPNVPPEILDGALKADPTGGGYANWIVDKAIAGVIALPEDADKVRELLDRFNRLKQSPKFKGDKNLYSYKTYGDLARVVGQKETKGRTNKIKEVEGIVQAGKKGRLSLVQLTTPQAAAAVCKNTHWCIKDPRFYDSYAKTGKLYVVLKSGKPYVAVHTPSQAMDVYDDPINPEVAQEIAPLFKGILLNKSAYDEDAAVHNQKRQDMFFEQVHAKWVADHMAKYGRQITPMSKEKAERAWRKVAALFKRMAGGVGHERGFINQGLINLAQAQGIGPLPFSQRYYSSEEQANQFISGRR